MGLNTELGERKLTILKAIIQNYLETGEPVGSRTLSKYTDLNLSSATIRNEMADLEDLGYIFQPHTSAGRIPSDKGYRLYVDMLMEEKEHEITELRNTMLEKSDKVDQVLKQAAKVLAVNTNYATMVSAPEAEYAFEYNTQRHVDRTDQSWSDRTIEGAGRNPQPGDQ